MKKVVVLFMFFLFSVVLVLPVSAEIKFSDVPDDHWAASAVYDLVKLGVTKGFPDGTFRGNKKIKRYEVAVFLSKLAKAISGTDVRADINVLKNEIAALKNAPQGGLPVSGSYLASWKAANLLASDGASRGAVANYRLLLSAIHNLGEGATVVVNLDTMDYGYYSSGTTADLPTDLLDIESNLRIDLSDMGLENPVDLKLTYGPGARQHADSSGILPSEDGIVYARPDTGVMASTNLWGMDLSGGYIVADLDSSGKINISRISGTIGYTFGDVLLFNTLRLNATGDYLSSGMFSSSTRDMRANITLAAPLTEKIDASGTLGIGSSTSQGMMFAGEVTVNDIWESGTEAIVRVARVGSKFINTDATFAEAEFDFAGLDAFDRPLEAGTFNLGGEVIQNVSDDIKLIGKGNVRLTGNYKYEAPNGRLTAQGGVSYAIAPNTSLDAIYRVDQDKTTADTTDLAALGLFYNF